MYFDTLEVWFTLSMLVQNGPWISKIQKGTLAHPLSLVRTFALSISLSLGSLFLFLSQALSLSLSLSLSFSLCLCVSLSLSISVLFSFSFLLLFLYLSDFIQRHGRGPWGLVVEIGVFIEYRAPRWQCGSWLGTSDKLTISTHDNTWWMSVPRLSWRNATGISKFKFFHTSVPETRRYLWYQWTWSRTWCDYWLFKEVFWLSKEFWECVPCFS